MKKSFNYYQILGYVLVCFFAVPAFASQEYTVLPLVIDQKVEGRDIISKEIVVTNTGPQPVTVYPTVNNISLKEGGTIQEFLPPVQSDRTSSLASWIEISRLGIDLAIGEKRTIPLTFRVNPNPVAGTYHAFIGFGTGGNRDEAEKLVAEGRAPGTLITVTVDEEKNEFLKLSKFVVSRFVTKSDNKAAVFTFTNPGGEVLMPKGEIILYDGRGSEVGSLPVNDQNVSIAPGEEHSFEVKVPIDGLFGKYKAFLSVEYGTTQRASLQDTNFFYVFPLRTLLIVLGVLMLIVIGVAWHVHKKYLDDSDSDDSELLTVHVRDTLSEAKHHDIDLKTKQ